MCRGLDTGEYMQGSQVSIQMRKNPADLLFTAHFQMVLTEIYPPKMIFFFVIVILISCGLYRKQIFF